MTNSDALERAIRRGAAEWTTAADTCALCAAPLPGDHRHLLDRQAGRPTCVCRACALLFDSSSATRGRYRAVPARRLRVHGVDTALLGVPVGLAFFAAGDDGRVLARYPSPAGATEWEVDRGDWEHAVGQCSDLASLEPEVEALLVNTARGNRDAWIVPVTDCFRLVALIRRHWRGLSGGDRVWPAIDGFFDQLKEEAWDRSGSARPT